jgi:hypothetical protein
MIRETVPQCQHTPGTTMSDTLWARGIVSSPPGFAPDPRAWLDHIPPLKRSTVANWFHQAVRGGARTPAAVYAQVLKTATRRLQDARDTATAQSLSAIRHTLTATQPAALVYAQSVLDYEALPYDARQRVKAERTRLFIHETMRGKPVTPAQIAYLHALGYRGPSPPDRAAASTLIDHLRSERGHV